jgi:chromosome partitioning protein
MGTKTLKKTIGRVTAVANYKGGVGKSTAALHLACSEKAVLIDLDMNGDSSRFSTRYGLETYRMHNATAAELYDLVERLKNEGKNVVLDCPPGISDLTKLAILTADVVLCPTRPGPHDVFALGRITTVVREAAAVRGPIPLFYLCNFYRNTEIAKTYCMMLQGSADGTFIGKLWERKEYAEAIDNGLPVWEFAPESTGATEMRNLVAFLSRALDAKQAETKRAANA